jgi:glycosyltransferase involved in cell wall biosynthesis
MRDALSRVDVFISYSEAARDRSVQWGVPAGKFVIAPRAFDPSLYEGFARTPRTASFRFGFVGQYAPHKGLHILIDAVRGLYGHRRDFTLALHGAPAGTLHPDYGVMMIERGKKLALPIEDRGPFAPQDTAKVFAGLDAVVMPSTWLESLPVTLLHAKATRTPVIATNVPGIREFLRNGVDGVMVTPGNSTSLAERMEKLMADPEMLKKFSDTSSLPATYAEHIGKIEAALGRG